MAIRVSELNAQVLLTPGVYLRTVEQDLNLEQETFRRTVRVLDVSCQLLVDGGVPPIDRTVSQELTFSETILNELEGGEDFERTVSQELTFSETTLNELEGSDNVEQTLDLQQTVVDFLEIAARQVVSHHLDFEQGIDVFGYDNVGDNLNLEQTIEFTGPRVASYQESLNLQQGIVGFIGVPWAPMVVEQTLDLLQFVTALAPLHVQQTINFVDSAVRMTIAEDFLLLFQTIQVGKGTSVTQNLGLSEALETNNSYFRTVDQDLGINQFVAYFTESRCGRKTNNRFNGEGAVAPEPRRIKYESKLILTYGSESVSLRNPEVDDRARFAFQRVNRETLGGVLDVYADPDWDQSTTLLFTVVAIKADLLESLQSFLQATVGQEITLHDWEGVNWLGVVTTPDESAVEDGEGYWTLAFEFVGVREPGEVPMNQLALAQTVGRQVDYTRTVEQSLNLVENPHAAGPINVTVSQVIPFQSGV